MKIWSQYLQYLQIYLEIFMYHLAAAVPLLETDSISPVCRYIIEIGPVLMAYIDRDFPLHASSFAWLVPRAHVAFSSEPSRNLLCATILDIILRVAAGPSTF